MSEESLKKLSHTIETVMVKQSAAKMRLLSLELQNQLRNKVIDNIKKLKKESESTLPRGRNKDNLLSSINVVSKGEDGFTLTIGNDQVRHAAITELGGVITPKKRRWLTIPLTEEAANKRATEFTEAKVIRTPDGIFIGYPKQTRSGRKFIELSGKPLYRLTKQSVIKSRPYLKPALNQVFSAENMAATLMKVFGSDTPFVIGRD